MRVSEAWLRSWIDPPLELEALCHALTMLGLEVGAIASGAHRNGIFEIELTPNRGDCASILGLARELSALYPELPCKIPESVMQKPLHPNSNPRVSIAKEAQVACPYYCYAVVSEISPTATTPLWMQECLEAAGIACHHLVVDTLNFVMLERGQPLHAFDMDAVQGSLLVAYAKLGDTIEVLSGQTLTLTEETLVIKDACGPLAIAGIMGGSTSAVRETTTSVLLESAWFTKESISGKARQYGLHTESSYRFERGVDPHGVCLALERACQLLQELGGGQVVEQLAIGDPGASYPEQIIFDPRLVNRLLGVQDSPEMVARGFERLGFKLSHTGQLKWVVSIPSYRQDLSIAEDLVEEHARLWGLDRIESQTPKLRLQTTAQHHSLYRLRTLKRIFVAQGLQEAIHYSFVDPKVQPLLSPKQGLLLKHPIADNRAVMRTTLWTGLLETLAYHQNRQQTRVRLFEIGTCFEKGDDEDVTEEDCVAGLLTGTASKEQWHAEKRMSDFFDLKWLVEQVIRGMGHQWSLSYQAETHVALHPGQSATLCVGSKIIGVLGALHPTVLNALKLEGPVWLFELKVKPLLAYSMPHPEVPPKFPSVRRDLALLVPDHLQAVRLLDSISDFIGASLHKHCLFDVYRGKGVPNGFCSMAIGLVFQDPARTLVDKEVETTIQSLLIFLKEKFGVILR